MISTPTDSKTKTENSLNLEQYGILGAREIIRNPSFETLYAEETAAGLNGYEKSYLTEYRHIYRSLAERQVSGTRRHDSRHGVVGRPG
jgi:hypothetical protein